VRPQACLSRNDFRPYYKQENKYVKAPADSGKHTVSPEMIGLPRSSTLKPLLDRRSTTEGIALGCRGRGTPTAHCTWIGVSSRFNDVRDCLAKTGVLISPPISTGEVV